MQVNGGILGEAVQCVYVCGKNVQISESLAYLGKVVHNNGGSHQKVIPRTAVTYGVMDSIKTIM